MSDNTESTGGGLPPKLNLRKEGILKAQPAGVTPAADAQQPRITVPKAGETPVIKTSAAPVVSTPDSKKETTKLAADGAGDTAPITLAGSTGVRPKAGPAPARAADDAKGATSRISLESAVAPYGGETPLTPKTIKLKRPTEGIVIPPSAVIPQGVQEGSMGKTSRLDESLLEQEEGPSPTRKKTIRVKRPTAKPGVTSVSRPGKPAGQAPVPQPELLWQTDEPHVLFPLIMTAAVIVTCVTIYMLCSQVFGPNVSLTELSYGGYTTELPWPGRIPMDWSSMTRRPSAVSPADADAEVGEEEMIDEMAETDEEVVE